MPSLYWLTNKGWPHSSKRRLVDPSSNVGYWNLISFYVKWKSLSRPIKIIQMLSYPTKTFGNWKALLPTICCYCENTCPVCCWHGWQSTNNGDHLKMRFLVVTQSIHVVFEATNTIGTIQRKIKSTISRSLNRLSWEKAHSGHPVLHHTKLFTLLETLLFAVV